MEDGKQNHSMGSPMDRTPHSLKTNNDHLMKDDRGHYCPFTIDGKTERWCHGELNPGPLA